MRVIDLINSNEKTAFSFEILPPLKGTGIEKLYQTIDTLREFDPKYINITTHRSEYVYKDLGNGLFQRNRLRRRPGTVAVAAAIQNKYNITMVPHILAAASPAKRRSTCCSTCNSSASPTCWCFVATRQSTNPLLSPWATVTTTPSNYKSKSTTSIKVFLWTAPR